MGASKSWREIRDETLLKWRELRDRLGKTTPKEFLLDAGEMCALCEKAEAMAESMGRKMKCRFCGAFLAYGGCQPIVRRITEASLDKDWESIRSEVDDVIERLESAGEEEFALLEKTLGEMMEDAEKGGVAGPGTGG